MPYGIDQLLRIPLAPLLLVQALGVRKRANQLPEPPGNRSGTCGTGPELNLLIIGDSSAAGVGAGTQSQALSGQLTARLSEHFQVHWRLIAETGATTKTILQKLEHIDTQPADIVVSALGVNDVTRGFSRARWTHNQDRLAQVLATRFNAHLIVASGLPPMGMYPKLPQPLRWILGQQANRLDQGLAALCAKHPILSHMPLDVPFEPRYQASDGYHPSEEAYALWATLLTEHIRKHL
ncbi:SGNH/GDSL hydrolase family protein [Shimia marina]|uniref:GDSL-like Lipase/Acylhydrolase n=1 Tax=Shimia marina TaxID=321267 RepID=A0A0P1FAN8_9RHOB|nr:SGNH/GDSL hydrolase family protein [Shimia marina]CUH51039.1 GDSL-like Lipase/Acylhydrolase [Shimia marina]SFD59737.1 Lysophospholipase L1 [Shimia marina]